MIESLLFLLLSIVAGFGLLVGMGAFGLGIYNKSDKLRKLGLKIFGLSALPIIIFFVYYSVFVPLDQRNFERKYSGNYLFVSSILSDTEIDSTSNTKYILNLNNNNTYKLDPTPNVNLPNEGKWDSKSDEGDLKFYDLQGNTVGEAYPLPDKVDTLIIFNFHEPKAVAFKKIR